MIVMIVMLTLIACYSNFYCTMHIHRIYMVHFNYILVSCIPFLTSPMYSPKDMWSAKCIKLSLVHDPVLIQ